MNLVFFKKVLSKIKFWQMIGRGSRLCDNLKVISPSKAYFERLTNDKTRQLYEAKQGFLIFDICNVFPFFKMNPDGRTDTSEQALSLYQKIFLQKATLYKAMYANFSKLVTEDRKYYEQLRDELVEEVKNLNRNYIGVISNLKYVDKYSTANGWINFSQQDLIDVKKHIAPNVSGEIDLEAARAFDYLCYRFAATRYNVDAEFKKTAKTIYALSSYLLNFKLGVGDVANHAETLQYVTSNEFLHDSTVNKVNEVREELRDLMRYIDSKDFKPIISDFDDQISSFEDADEEEVDFHITIDDFKSLEEKVRFFIQSNPDIPLIHKIQYLIKPNKMDVEELKQKIIEIAKTAEEYNDLFGDDNSIVTFVRKNIELSPVAIDAFIELEKAKGLSGNQIIYIKELLLFISQNGKFERTDLLREELNFNSIFNSVEINNLLTDIEERL